MLRETKRSAGLAALLDHVVAEQADALERNDINVTGERFGCGASTQDERRACSLFLWLLGPTTEQLATTCPCQS